VFPHRRNLLFRYRFLFHCSMLRHRRLVECLPDNRMLRHMFLRHCTISRHHMRYNWISVLLYWLLYNCMKIPSIAFRSSNNPCMFDSGMCSSDFRHSKRKDRCGYTTRRNCCSHHSLCKDEYRDSRQAYHSIRLHYYMCCYPRNLSSRTHYHHNLYRQRYLNRIYCNLPDYCLNTYLYSSRIRYILRYY